MQERWVAIDFNGTVSLVTLDSDDPTKFYWGGGSSWCVFLPTTRIVKDYGLVDDMDDDKIDAIELEFYKEFTVRKAEKPFQSAGWISPEGDFYPCSWRGHDSLAKAISRVLFNSDLGARELEQNHWARVYSDGEVIGSDLLLTEDQLIAIVEMIMDPDSVMPDIFKDNLVRTLERQRRMASYANGEQE